MVLGLQLTFYSVTRRAAPRFSAASKGKICRFRRVRIACDRAQRARQVRSQTRDIKSQLRRRVSRPKADTPVDFSQVRKIDRVKRRCGRLLASHPPAMCIPERRVSDTRVGRPYRAGRSDALRRISVQ